MTKFEYLGYAEIDKNVELDPLPLKSIRLKRPFSRLATAGFLWAYASVIARYD